MALLKITPQEAGAKLARNIQNAGQDYITGIRAVTESPMEKAANAADKWLISVQNAKDKFAANTRAVTMAEWKAAVESVGQSRYTGSATKAGANYTKFATKFYPFLEGVMQEVNAMPGNTFEENVQRMVTNARRLHEFRNV